MPTITCVEVRFGSVAMLLVVIASATLLSLTCVLHFSMEKLLDTSVASNDQRKIYRFGKTQRKSRLQSESEKFRGRPVGNELAVDGGGLFLHAPPSWSRFGWPYFDQSLAQDDPTLVDFVRDNVLVPPSPPEVPYNLDNPLNETRYSQFGKVEDELIPLLFGNPPLKRGTFFEAGGLDGEWMSTTLHMERVLEWSGLVAEMAPSHGKWFMTKNRKTWFAPVCLSPKPWPIMTTFRARYADIPDAGASILAHAFANQPPEVKRDLIMQTVPCFPLYSLLVAANLTTLDFCSIDVEGVELKVLATVPWDRVNIKVILLDLMHTPEGRPAVHEFLSALNYRPIRKQENARGYTYVRRDWASSRNLRV